MNEAKKSLLIDQGLQNVSNYSFPFSTNNMNSVDSILAVNVSSILMYTEGGRLRYKESESLLNKEIRIEAYFCPSCPFKEC